MGLLSDVKPWNIVAEGYVDEVKPIFELWAKDAFARVGIEPNHDVIDIACGPGTVSLLLADLVNSIQAYDFSEAMIEQFQKEIASREIANITLEQCDCQKLYCGDNLFDRAFSQFGLMFFPDRAAGFSEMYRVLKPGGVGAVYSWAPIAESTAMQMMMGAMGAGFPEVIQSNNYEKRLEGLDSEEVFVREMEAAGFVDVTTEKISHSFPVHSVEDFWASQVKGSAPITFMKANADEKSWRESEERAISFLEENLTEDSLYSTAILGIGKKRR